MAPQSSEPQIASDAIKQKYSEILKSNGILDEVSKVSIHEPAFLKGEHMASASLYVNVQFKNAAVKPKNLFVKCYVDNEAFKAMMKESKIMEKETSFFLEFLPDAREFCRKYPGCESIMDFFPKCLYGDDEMVVLENVVLDDTFIMLKKEDGQDLDTAKTVLTNLAKFHGTTYSMIKEMGHEKFQNKYPLVTTECFISETNSFAKDMLDNGISSCVNILKGNPIDGSSDAIKRLNSYYGKSFDIMKDLLEFRPNAKLNVLNHGDCWGNNMLFKKDSESDRVTDHIFIDLQVTRLGSPSLDLSYFLYTSMRAPIRRAHMKELLQHYFQEFKKTIEAFGQTCPVNYEGFLEEYKEKSLLGFFFNLTFLSAAGAMKDVDLTSMKTDDGDDDVGKAFQCAVDKWIKNNPKIAAEMAIEIVAFVREYFESSVL